MKTACLFCGGHIEYDAQLAGVEITCPHCSARIVLPSAPQLIPPRYPRPRSSAKRVLLRILAGFILVAVGLPLVVGLGWGLLKMVKVMRAGIPLDVRLSEQQWRDFDRGHEFTPEEIQAIRKGRTAGFTTRDKMTAIELVACKSVAIVDAKVVFVKQIGDLTFASLQVEFSNSGRTNGSGSVWLHGFDRSKKEVDNDVFPFWGIPPGRFISKPVEAVFDTADWRIIRTWQTKWEPDTE